MVSHKTERAKQLLKCINYTQRIDSARPAVAILHWYMILDTSTGWLILDH